MNFGGNPERSAQQRLDRMRRNDDIDVVASRLLPHHETISRYIRSHEINPRDLIDPYDKEVVEKDIREAAELKDSMARTMRSTAFSENLTLYDVRRLADIAEYEVFIGINRQGWIPCCRAIKTAEYDDIKNGVDMVMEYSNESSLGHLGLAIDVTFSQNLEKKFLRIKESIDKDELSKVKYFHSERSGMHGRLSGIPRVVAGFDIEVMDDILRMKASKDHVARHLLITQIRRQLETFAAYAEHRGKECAGKLKYSLQFVKALETMMESEQVLASSDYSKNRKIEEEITGNLTRLF